MMHSNNSAGLKRIGSGRASGGRIQPRTFGLAPNSNFDGKIAGLYDLEETLGQPLFESINISYIF